MHRVLVACGTGAATSTHVAVQIKEKLAQRGIEVTTTQCRIQDVELNLSGIDVVVTTAILSRHLEIPAFNGVPFLTGIGAAALLDQIAEALLHTEATG